MTAAAGIVAFSSPASAAGCDSAVGVTLVVDFHELGGGVQQVCDLDGAGKSASTLFPDNGFPLTYVQRQPGFVCRVKGLPTQEQEPCVNTPPGDAYWGLWWTDGESGTWTYSTEGASSLDVPDGGAMAFSWNGSSTKSPPGVAAPTHEDEPSSSPSPTQPAGGAGGGGGSNGGSGGGSGTSSTPAPGTPQSSTPGESPSAGDDAQSDGPGGKQGEEDQGGRKGDEDEGKKRSKRDGEKAESRENSQSTSPSESATPDDALVADPTSDASDDRLPAWVAPVGIAALFGVAGVLALLRRRRSA